MNVSLTERCYDLLRREAPVASDLRFVVSVLRVLGELERIGDLALRVVKLAPDHDLLAAQPADLRHPPRRWPTRRSSATGRRCGRGRRWTSTLATDLVDRRRATMDVYYERLMGELLRLDGPDAVRDRDGSVLRGRALERIADHAAIIGARLRYLLTGDPDHLAAEVR